MPWKWHSSGREEVLGARRPWETAVAAGLVGWVWQLPLPVTSRYTTHPCPNTCFSTYPVPKINTHSSAASPCFAVALYKCLADATRQRLLTHTSLLTGYMCLCELDTSKRWHTMWCTTGLVQAEKQWHSKHIRHVRPSGVKLKSCKNWSQSCCHPLQSCCRARPSGGIALNRFLTAQWRGIQNKHKNVCASKTFAHFFTCSASEQQEISITLPLPSQFSIHNKRSKPRNLATKHTKVYKLINRFYVITSKCAKRR